MLSSPSPPPPVGFEETDRIDAPSEPLVYDILVGADMGGGGKRKEDPKMPDFRLAVGSVSEPEPAYNTQQVRTSSF